MRLPRTTFEGKVVADWGLLGGLSASAATVAIDLVSGVQLGGTYAVGAIVASMFSSTRRTAAVATFAVLASLAAGSWHSSFGDREWFVGVIACVATAILAVFVAHNRETREARLRRITAIAQTAQEAVLRSPPPTVGSLDIAAKYVSAAQDALVGGDLYEVVARSSAPRLIIGDVRGKGLDAVRTAATVMGAFRQAGYKEPNVAAVARAIDDVIGRVIEDEEFITALMAEFGDADVTIANCGHHPPYRIRDAIGVLLNTGPTTPPLGLGADPGQSAHSFVPGDRLLLYTDGLVEARNHDGDFFPIEAHLERLAAGNLDAALDALVEELRQFVGGQIRDDVALVLVQKRAKVPTAVEGTGPQRRRLTGHQPGSRRLDRRAEPQG